MSHKEENNKNKVGMEESKDLIKIKIYIGKMCGFHGLDFRQNKKSTQRKTGYLPILCEQEIFRKGKQERKRIFDGIYFNNEMTRPHSC